ncbi:cytochrome c family protein [Pseudomonadota bacterium]
MKITIFSIVSLILFCPAVMSAAEESDVKKHWANAESASSEDKPSMKKAEAPTYIGIENCKICHMPHFDSWKTTRMSQAFELLKPGVRAKAKRDVGLDPDRDYSRSAECLHCHTTGYGKPGGFISMQETPKMANVQCEMCHGPGSLYAEMMLKKRGTYTREDFIKIGGMTMPSPDNNVCSQQCHNQTSPFIGSGFEFDFEDRKAIGTHRHDIKYIGMPFDW